MVSNRRTPSERDRTRPRTSRSMRAAWPSSTTPRSTAARPSPWPSATTSGCTGCSPPALETLEQQVARSYEQFKATESDVEKWTFLTNLHDNNEVLFYRLVGEHVHEMLPIVYTPTVGAAIQEFSHLFRRPRGVFLNIEDVDGIDRALDATGLGPDDIDLVVASDAEAILGIGDWGVGGIDISIGKLAVYTVAAGIDPRRVLAVGLDVGTNREVLLNDPRYLGLRRSRVRGEAYEAFIDAYIASASAHFPKAILHWEDFSGPPARRILAQYGDTLCTFDDDIQGTAAVGLACVLAGVRVSGRPAGRPADRRLRRGLGGRRHRRPHRARDDRGRAERPGGGRPDLPARPPGPAHQRHDRPLRLPAAVRQGPRRGRRMARGRRDPGPAGGRRRPAPDDARRHLRGHRGLLRAGDPLDARALPPADHPADVQPDGARRADPGEPAGLDRRAGAGRDRQPVRAGRARRHDVPDRPGQQRPDVPRVWGSG